jgi:hypothetical protein
VADEGFGNRAPGSAAGDEQRQARQAELVVGITRDQASDEGIGEAAMCSDRIDLRPLPLSHP